MINDRSGGRRAAPTAHGDITVRVDLDDPELAGELIVEARPAGAFRGWLGLLTALDRELDALHGTADRRRLEEQLPATDEPDPECPCET